MISDSSFGCRSLSEAHISNASGISLWDCKWPLPLLNLLKTGWNFDPGDGTHSPVSSPLQAEANRTKSSTESTTGWYPEVLGPAPQLNNFFTSFEDLESNLVLIQKPLVAFSMACEGSWSYQTSVPVAHGDTNSASALVASQSSVPCRASAVTADLLVDGVCARVCDRWADLPPTLNSCSYYFSRVLHNV